MLLTLCAPSVRAQAPAAPAQAEPAAQPVQAPTAPPVTAQQQGGAAPAEEEDEDWRDTSEYRFLSLGDASLRLEMVAMAMQVRDYCANRRVPDDFVRDRLARLSVLSGRTENCRSLLDY
ncbi:hypothetical protein E6C76_07855 [Pseudothauera nasutitermitis]|uniref:Uncharacterized protein n=1 Tax=Pseudothauera nasutitermitis TaxID=2565930 RepID=A0A4S4B0H0_9RHOO|nr:hypothetical protein E6C76_07855 [Pseudothauera nasutitermitis]